MFYPSWTLPVPGILHYALCRPLFSLIAHLFAVFNDSRVNDKVTWWDKVRFKNRSRSQVIIRDQTYIRNTLLSVRFYRSCSIIELRRTWHNDLTISCSIFIIFDFRCNSRSNITYNNIASQVEDFSQNSLKDRRSVRVTKFYLLWNLNDKRYILLVWLRVSQNLMNWKKPTIDFKFIVIKKNIIDGCRINFKVNNTS